MTAETGDGVFYHGTKVNHHGLYTVVAVNETGRAILCSPDTDTVLEWARPESFEILIPATP